MVSGVGTVQRAAVAPETVEHPMGVTLQSLADFKTLSVRELENHGCQQRTYAGHPAVAIPYLGSDRSIRAMRYRTALRKSIDGGDDRFRWRQGDKAVHLYGQDRLASVREAGWVLIVEGESDCWTGWHWGLPVVGVPGKANWKTEMARLLDGVEAYGWQEPEAEDFSERIGRDLRNLRVIAAPDEVKDISEAHVAGLDVGKLIHDLRAAAVPIVRMREQHQMERLPGLREAALAVLGHPDPLDLYRASISAQGYGGDQNAPLVALLAATSRLLVMRSGSMPVHLLLLGPASAGKSYALSVALAHLPQSAHHVIDAGSPRTLIYDDSDLVHRVVVFSESDSLPAGEDNPAASAIRNMLQDHHLHYAVTVRDPQSGDFSVREIDKEGPTTLITTSTRRLGPQLDTRVFICSVPDDQGQTGHALRTQAALERMGGALPVRPELVAFQEYLQALAPWDVVVPFAGSIADHLASQPLEPRATRDYKRLLSLTKSVAILRHAHRQRDDDGRLVATIEDYAVVFALVREIYEASTTGASRQVRDVVEAVVRHLDAGHLTMSQAEVMRMLCLSRAAASRRTSAALAGGWLVNDETVKGRPAKLRIGEPLPGSCGLPTPEELECSTDPVSTVGTCAPRAKACPTG